MSKFYVKYQETKTWHGTIEADSLDHASEIAEQAGKQQKDDMLCVIEPFRSVFLSTDHRECPTGGSEWSCMESVYELITEA
jgi:hypothetical protein